MRRLGPKPFHAWTVARRALNGLAAVLILLVAFGMLNESGRPSGNTVAEARAEAKRERLRLAMGCSAVLLTTVAAGGGPALHRMRKIRDVRRRRAGVCAACGYDLRASTERCPECGTSTVKPPEKIKI